MIPVTRSWTGALCATAILLSACQSDTPQANITTPSATSHDALPTEAIPGTNPDTAIVPSVSASVTKLGNFELSRSNSVASTNGGLTPLYSAVGKVTLSVDGSGNLGTGVIRVNKPSALATVRSAWMLAASTGFSGYQIQNGDITIGGQSVTFTTTVPSSIRSFNSSGDVTSLVKATLDAAPAGITSFSVTERNSGRIDGEVLAVVFDDPTQTQDNTATVLFGAQKTTGDDFYINYAAIDKADPKLQMDLGLGISFGYQTAGNGSQQSNVDVNGLRLTSCAGGQDDGLSQNGALLTVGGIGDSNANPANPYSCGGPLGFREDDELYDLRPFVHSGDTQAHIHTINPSNDDNIFFASLFLTVKAQVAVTPVPTDVTPPVITPAVTGTLGTNSWYTSDVGVHWTVTDAESPISNKTGCGDVTLSSNSAGTTYTCSATSLGGTSSKSVTVKRDASIPVVAPTATGTLGTNGWYISTVSLAWGVSGAGPSDVSVTSSCNVQTLSTDTPGTPFACTATTGAGIATTGNITIKRDVTPPVVVPTVTGPLGNGGWYRGDVTVSWTATDNVSAVTAVPCSANTLSTDNAGTTYSCSATNDAGLSGTATQSVKRDATVPLIGYTGNLGSYTVDQTVIITCAASDVMSGLASTTCANVTGAGYTFPLGTTTFSASAMDIAGNTNSASGSFTMTVTQASLCALVERWTSNTGVANSLCVKLMHGNYEPFINEVNAQSGKKIDADKAAILLRLVSAL